MRELADNLRDAIREFREKVRTDPDAAWEELKDIGLIDDDGRLAVGKAEDISEAMVPEVEPAAR